MKRCPKFPNGMSINQFIKFLDCLEEKYDDLDAPVRKYGVEAIIEDLEKKDNDDKIKINRNFIILIGTLLSLRTKDEVTYVAAQKLFEKIKTPEDVLKLSTEDIEKLIYPVGFYKKKAQLIKDIAKQIVEQFGGKVPSNLEDLLRLKGVGLKTANLVLSVGFGKSAICVDTHVHRICNRLGIVKTKTPEETEKKLREILPKKYWNKINKLLIAFGQTICKPVKPKCDECFVECVKE